MSGDITTGDIKNSKAVAIGTNANAIVNNNYYPIKKLRANRRNIFKPLLEKSTALFAGRDTAFAEIAKFINQPAGGYLVITATVGFGKTALMANLVSGTPEAFAYHFFNPYINASSVTEVGFLENVVEQMAQWHRHTEELPNKLADLQALYHQFVDKKLECTQILVLDGLDEVTTWKLHPYLSRRLPENLHIILTIRNVGQDWAEEYQLPKLPNKQFQHLPLGGLTRDDVAAVLRKAGIADDSKWLDEVMRVSAYQDDESLGADPFYVGLLAEDIVNEGLDVDDIKKQPKGLHNYLNVWWQNLKEATKKSPDQKKALEDLLSILTVTLGSIGRRDMEIIAPSLKDDWAADFFDDVLNEVRRFVFGNEDQGYALVHPRLREYMRSKIVDYSNKLLDFCTKWQEHHSPYALAHYAQHLVDAKLSKDLHDLLAQETSEGRNAWYEAKEKIGDTAGFLADVSLAWKLAEEDFTRQSSESIALQCRYALIISSINSIIEKLPTELVLELVKKAPVKGLPYFQKLVKNQNIDLEILSKPEYQLSQIQEEVEKIDNNNIYKIQVKCALAECYSKAELLNILDAVKVIENEKDKGKALKMLISYLSYEQLSEALEGISDKEVVAEIWSLRPKYFREDKDLNEVLDKSKKYNNGYFRAIVLTGLVPYLSLEKISEALNIALDDKQASIEAQSNSLKALATAPHLNKEILQKILQQVEAQQFPPDFATQVWSALLHHFPSDELDNMLDKILEEVDKLEYEQSKAKVLSILVSQLSSVPLDISEKESETLILFKRKPNFWRCLLDRILEEVKKLKDEQYKAEVLSILASQFPSVPLDRILEEVDKLEKEEYKAKVLSTLATNIKITKDINIIENVKHIQNRAKAFQGQNNKSSVLSALAKHFCAEEILNILQKELHLIQDDFLMEETIKNLLYDLPLNQQENIPQQLQITLETENDRAKDFTLPFHFSPDKQKNIAQQLEIKRKIENDEGMKELMKLIVETDDNFERMKRLRSLVELAIEFHSDVDYLHRHWSEMLHNSANRQRDYFLFDFNALIPLISILDRGAIIKICHTLKEIGQQWP
ncbi:MAG: hypothetical protein HEQ27_04295 [Dolichospermum sp. JUN01]|nr:hypothetical protein [Dolichospermum sp. JUN01]